MVKCALFTETLNYPERYNCFRVENDTLKEMIKYVRYKIYNSVFGDFVPYIFSNALNINIQILEKFPSGEIRSSCTHDISDGGHTIVIFKEGEHYSAVMLKHRLTADISPVFQASRTCRTNTTTTHQISLCLHMATNKLNRRQSGQNHCNLRTIRPISPFPLKSKTSKLCLLNAQSARNKADIISDYLSTHDIDTAFITETCLKPEDGVVTGNLTPKGYTLHSSYRPDRPGGGICCIHKEGLQTNQFISGQTGLFEYMQGTIGHGTSTINLLILYCVPYSKKHKATLSTFFHRLFRLYGTISSTTRQTSYYRRL